MFHWSDNIINIGFIGSTIVVTINKAVVDPRGRYVCVHLFGPISFIFMKFWVKFLPNNRLVLPAMGFVPQLGNPGSPSGKILN